METEQKQLDSQSKPHSEGSTKTPDPSSNIDVDDTLSTEHSKSQENNIEEDYLGLEPPSLANHASSGGYISSSGKELAKLSWKRLVLLFAFLMIFPIFPITLSAGLGGILAAVEGARFIDGFLYVASNLLALTNPLSNFNPVNVGGVIIDVYVSVIGFLIFGVVLNVINVFQIPLYLNQQIEMFVSGQAVVPIIALGVVIPIYVSVVAIVFGSLLAFLEKWSITDGILYVFSNLLGLGTPLSPSDATTIGGDIVDIIVSSIALGATAVVVDYVTVLNPARYIRKQCRDWLDAWHVFHLAEPGTPSGHPLSYATDEALHASVQRSHQRRVDIHTEKELKCQKEGIKNKQQYQQPTTEVEEQPEQCQEQEQGRTSTGRSPSGKNFKRTDATGMQGIL